MKKILLFLFLFVFRLVLKYQINQKLVCCMLYFIYLCGLIISIFFKLEET